MKHLPIRAPACAEASAGRPVCVAATGRQASAIQRTQDLNGLLEQFLISQDIKQSSKTTYRRGLRNFFQWYSGALGDRALPSPSSGPTRETILAYKNHLEGGPACANRLREGFGGQAASAGKSPLTLSTYLTSVRRFFEWAESMKYYPNVAKGIRGSKRVKGFRKECLTVPQAKQLCLFPGHLSASPRQAGKTIEDLRDHALVNLMVRTALRTIEVIRADVEDLRQEGGEAVLWIQGKGRDAKDEFVLLTEETLKPLREYLSSKQDGEMGRSGDRSTAKDGGERNQPLFTSLSGRNHDGRLTTRSIRRIIKRRLADMGLVSKRLTAHSLRHTSVTLSLLGGASIQEAKILARHASIDTTLIYAHNISRISNAPERRIDQVLAGP